MKIILFLIAIFFIVKKFFSIKITNNTSKKNDKAIDVEYEEIE